MNQGSTPELEDLLSVLLDLDEDTLGDVYGIDRKSAADGAPLDAAIYAWRDSIAEVRKAAEVTP